MDSLTAIGEAVACNWPVWTVTVLLILAAVIDGFELKVPNWITFPMIIAGWVYSVAFAETLELTWYQGLGYSLLGTAVGLALLLPAYAIGGMGAGDVKLLAGVGAWMHSTHTAYAFAASAVIGAVMAIVMVLLRRGWGKHYGQFWMIFQEILTVKNPEKLAEIAAERKPTMMLLPYGIPIAIGTIGYFVYNDMLTTISI
ncbi:MAG: prepilin peptidase [Planctomycetales bacterium]|nr:prepilin peptidase [Planctomycetales bacterium]